MLLLMFFKYLNLLHVYGLSLVNFALLFLISILQFKLQIKKSGGYIPFLQSFFTTFFTGTVAYVLFAAYLFLYAMLDPYTAELYLPTSGEAGVLTHFVILFFQGSGGSMIVALATSFYTARYEDGEVEL